MGARSSRPVSLQYRSVSRPEGRAVPGNFEATESQVAESRDGQVQLRAYLSSDSCVRGRMTCLEPVVVGLGNAPAAFLGMLKGKNIDKVVVRVGDESTLARSDVTYPHVNV